MVFLVVDFDTGTETEAKVGGWYNDYQHERVSESSRFAGAKCLALDSGSAEGFEVDNIPEEPTEEKYKSNVLFINLETKALEWKSVDRSLTETEKLYRRLEEELEKNKTPDQRYRELNPTATSLDQLKKAKIDQLNEACEAAILQGFTSATTGHFYAFGSNDQSNFTQQMLLLIADPSLTEVTWKTEDAGVIGHTREQFLAVCREAEQHKRAQIGWYWLLKEEVEAASTWQQVDATVWRTSVPNFVQGQVGEQVDGETEVGKISRFIAKLWGTK
ncbi:hypothetical protein [Tumebacillus lipolyticus]|uniref:DUF4376 domain-containing protein n=1 Tax=Tumebacillus lipolyticus TaxID=1280370 RepID=A0ABW4ZWB7_9BACL